MQDTKALAPRIELEKADREVRAWLVGDWTVEYAHEVEARMAEIAGEASGANHVLMELSEVNRLDTLGAWVLDRTRQELGEQNVAAAFVGARAEHHILLNEVAWHVTQPEIPRHATSVVDVLADVGHTVHEAGQAVETGIGFLGEVIAATARVVLNPRKFRVAAFVTQMEHIVFRGVPIIVLISFLVGCIVAQQGIFQLQRFGAQSFVVNLVGILILRELGVLLTSIMVAGRSGSAFTAEIGSMKMREEIDALRVMGLNVVEVLIVPRMLALVIGLPILSFISALAALLGSGLVAWLYGDIAPDVFIQRLQASVDLKTFSVGMIKAPFMAMVIGIIASVEGMAVRGSAESLGRRVTTSVVQSIFMVIVLDGFFAIFFAAIRY